MATETSGSARRATEGSVGSPREREDALPFGSPEKARRYETDRYQGAVGRNWYDCDPSLQFLTRYYLGDDGARCAEPYLRRVGAVMGGRVATLAEETDRQGPTLRRYDKWGHEVSDVVLPPSLLEARRLAIDTRVDGPMAEEACRHGVSPEFLARARSYLLNQADIGLACALGTGAGMVERLVDQFAPLDVREWVMARVGSEGLAGETAQLLTERTGGSDLGALETSATPDGDAWRLNGLKWFVSNANGSVFVVLAKPEGAPDSVRGIAPFLVLKERRDGSRNGIRIRRLKDKLGTRSVASAEVELIDAEAFLLSGPAVGEHAAGPTDGRGLARMMAMTNAARLGIAMMGLGCARRALAESICYAAAREAFRRRTIEHPLMRRKLVELIVDVEAAQALVFDAGTVPNRQRSAPARLLRLAAPLVKLQVARLGITAASDAIEIHGGNGYVEDWPVARILRDAQVNTVWEGTDNILCLDVRRAIEREQADEPFLERIREALENAGEIPVTQRLRPHLLELEEATRDWKRLNERDRETAESALFELSQAMGRVFAAALLAEQAAWEQATRGSTRKEVVTQLYIDRHLSQGRWRRVAAEGERLAIGQFEELVAGAFRFEPATSSL